MGTFLRIVGVIVLIFGVLFIVLSVVGMGNIFGLRRIGQPYTLPSPGEENFPSMPFWGGLAWLGGVGGILGGFGIMVCGVTLFCIGSIYNDVKNLQKQ